jgi:cyclopropane-fatty-acyl-phospholipid synthase
MLGSKWIEPPPSAWQGPPGPRVTTAAAGIDQATDRAPTEEPFLDLARRAARESFGPQAGRPFAIRYWNGFTEPGVGGSPPPFTIVVRSPGALRTALLPPSEVVVGEAFLRGDLGVEGSLEAAASLAGPLAERLSSPRRIVRLAALLLRLPSNPNGSVVGPLGWRPGPFSRRRSRPRDAAAVRHHYDVGNEFYQLWLDAERVYSCAYFVPGVRDIDAAQVAKLDYICRKLRLGPGERFLDVGCGWGALIRHAARYYGVEAVGITLSPAQAKLARRRIAEDGLGNRCRVDVRDYRDLPASALYHKAATVGMVEHVGRVGLQGYFETVFRRLRPGGLFLYHGIVDLERTRAMSLRIRALRWLWRKGQFLQRYVFPDGELPELAEVVRAAERVGFESRDLESLREHYVLTLRHWLKRLEARKPEAVAQIGETRFRIWRLYLAGSAHAFATGRIGVVQLLLSKPSVEGSSDLPRTRHDLYAGAPGPRTYERIAPQPGVSSVRDIIDGAPRMG